MVTFTCQYDYDVKWFFMDITDLPKFPPIATGNVLSFKAQESHNGFLFCHGITQDGTRKLARSFLEVVSK